MLQDILYHAYNRSVEVGRNRRLAEQDYSHLFQVNTPDISRNVLRAIFRFSGNPLPEEVLEQIICEGGNFEPQTVSEEGLANPSSAVTWLARLPRR